MTLRRSDWLIPLGLVLLSAVPVIAGSVRLAMLASGVSATPETVRFVSSPVPVILHIVGATIYCLIGAFQFSAALRARFPRWHRVAGRVLVVAGLTAAGSGIWMALTYAIVPADTPVLHAFRLAAGTGMAVSLVAGFLAILRGQVGIHRAWMRRAYAIGQGAGTQAVLGLPLILIFGQLDPVLYTAMMGAGWGINLAIAEWIGWRSRRPRRVALATA
jgi:uncharacterized membrane protein